MMNQFCRLNVMTTRQLGERSEVGVRLGTVWVEVAVEVMKSYDIARRNIKMKIEIEKLCIYGENGGKGEPGRRVEEFKG